MKQTLQMCVEEAKRLQTQIEERKVLLRKAKIDVQKAVREKDAARNDNKRYPTTPVRMYSYEAEMIAGE